MVPLRSRRQWRASIEVRASIGTNINIVARWTVWDTTGTRIRWRVQIWRHFFREWVACDTFWQDCSCVLCRKQGHHATSISKRTLLDSRSFKRVRWRWTRHPRVAITGCENVRLNELGSKPAMFCHCEHFHNLWLQHADGVSTAIEHVWRNGNPEVCVSR